MNPGRITRRAMMAAGASALLLADRWPGALAAEQTSTTALDFFIINDTHYMTPDCGKWLEKVVASMQQQKATPQFCIIAGDLTEKGDAKGMAAVRDIFGALKMPVHVVPGNHDYIKGTDRAAYDSIYPRALNYTFDAGGWQFVALDSTDGTKSVVEIQKPTLDWCDANLPKIDKNKPLLLYTHFPLGPKVKMRAGNADALLDRFKEHNLRAVFGGHYHAFTETTIREIPIKTNRCCALKRQNHDGSLEKGYFLCSIKEDKVTPTFVKMAP